VKRDSLSVRIGAVFLLVIVLVAGELGLVIVLSGSVSDHASVARLAAVERSRSQRIAKEILLLDRADSAEVRANIQTLRDDFSRTLTALTSGGAGTTSALGNAETLQVPAADGPLLARLRTTEEQWRAYDVAVGTILGSNYHGPEFDAALAKAIELNAAFPASLESVADVAQGDLDSALTLLRLLAGAGAVTVIIVLAAAWVWVRRSVVRPIQTLAGTSVLMSSGDLTATVASDGRGDEIGSLNRSFGEMASGLRRSLLGVQEAVNNLSSASAEIVAAVNQLTAGATEESAAVAEIGTTAEEVRATAEQATERARAVADAASRSGEVAAEGQSAVGVARDGLADVSAKVDMIAQRILALSERTQAIGDIVTTVNDLADQSNLLAVNAAIEAAKAGEQGRGFAVVAQEVRNLADQSRAATAQVASILGDIQKAANGAVIVTEQGTKGVAAAVERVDQAGAVIDTLASTVEEAKNLARQIAATTGQQRAGVDQIATGIGNVSQVSNQTLAAARQLQQEADGLLQLAQHLEDMTSRFRLTDDASMLTPGAAALATGRVR
jgi:methyl-accepting chemotaxis protein